MPVSSESLRDYAKNCGYNSQRSSSIPRGAGSHIPSANGGQIFSWETGNPFSTVTGAPPRITPTHRTEEETGQIERRGLGVDIYTALMDRFYWYLNPYLIRPSLASSSHRMRVLLLVYHTCTVMAWSFRGFATISMPNHRFPQIWLHCWNIKIICGCGIISRWSCVVLRPSSARYLADIWGTF